MSQNHESPFKRVRIEHFRLKPHNIIMKNLRTPFPLQQAALDVLIQRGATRRIYNTR